ncbi:MAG: ClbS/DfsB family four-helix bundle protein [Pseudomonadota bacterium]
MAATTKDALLHVTDAEWAKLSALLASIPHAAVLQPDDEGTTIKDIVGHRAHWIALFLRWYHDGQAGREVHFPAPGYKWSDLKAYNIKLRADQAGLGWQDVCTLLEDRHAALRAFISAHENDALYGGKMKGGRNAWTAGRWAEAAGPSHYRSAAKYIRGRLRAMG